MSPTQSFCAQRSGVAESIAPLGAWRYGPCDFAQGDGDIAQGDGDIGQGDDLRVVQGDGRSVAHG